MNPSRPNNNLEGEAKCYSPTLQSKGPGLSFLGLLIHTGDEISTEWRDRDNGRECQRWSAESVKPTPVCVGFRPNLARPSGFPTGSGEVVWVFGYIRPKPTLSISLCSHTKRDPTEIPCIPTGSLFLCRRPVCVGDGSFFLSLFLRRRPDLSSGLFSVASRRMNRLKHRISKN
jgi:hypothetical protein